MNVCECEVEGVSGGERGAFIILSKIIINLKKEVEQPSDLSLI